MVEPPSLDHQGEVEAHGLDCEVEAPSFFEVEVEAPSFEVEADGKALGILSKTAAPAASTVATRVEGLRQAAVAENQSIVKPLGVQIKANLRNRVTIRQALGMEATEIKETLSAPELEPRAGGSLLSLPELEPGPPEDRGCCGQSECTVM